MFKVLVTGDRGWNDKELIRTVLSCLPKDTFLIEGGAPGADSIASNLATEFGFDGKTYPANWTKHGRAAGPIRNREMLDENPDIKLVIGFHHNLKESKGTKDCVGEVLNRNISVEVFGDSNWKECFPDHFKKE